MKIHRLTDPSSLLPPGHYLADIRTNLRRIEELIQNAEGFHQVDARVRLRELGECADSVCANLIRTAIAKVHE